MCTSCKFEKQTSSADVLPSVQTMNLADLNALQETTASRLSQRPGVAASGLKVASAVHTTSEGGVFVSTGSIGPLQGDVTLSGTLGPFPVELHLTVKLDNETETVTVSLEVVKPIHLGPFNWVFKLGGVTKDAQGKIIGAQAVTLSADTPAFPQSQLGSHVLCFLKCAGLAIAPILIECLGSLTGGPQGFIACVVAKAGSGAAAIAACVAKCAS